MQTTTMQKTIQKIAGGVAILALMLSQFGAAVTHARAAAPNLPVISEGASTSVTMDENGAPTPFSLTLHATSLEEGVTFTWSIGSPAGHGMAALADPATGDSMLIGYTPATDYAGADSFVVQVNDGGGGVAAITVNVTINAVIPPATPEPAEPTATLEPTDTPTDDTPIEKSNTNTAPEITEGASTSVTMNQNGFPIAFALSLYAADADGDTLIWSIASPASHGMAGASGTGNWQAVSYTPAPDYTGQDSFIVQVDDGNGGADTITVNVIINPPAVLGGITLISNPNSGSTANENSGSPSMSADGRYVAFQSAATNMVNADTNNKIDIFVYNRQTGLKNRVSVASNGAQATGDSSYPSISADGRYVAFQSTASNLVSGDTNGYADIFVRDLQTYVTTRVSVASDGTQGNSNSYGALISADGRYVAFESDASNLVNGDTNGTQDVFIRDLQTGTTRLVSVAFDGTQGNADSYNPSISADGRYVAFNSNASNLVSDDTNGTSDIFVHDMQTGMTTLASLDSDGAQADNKSYGPSISADGHFVAFYSYADNLVNGDTNTVSDVFVHDMQTGATIRISVASGGDQGNSDSYSFSISADGRYVAFDSNASNLVSADTNGATDVFVHDLQTGGTKRASVNSDNTQQGNGGSYGGSISSNGSYLALSSNASNLVSGDTNKRQDIFVRYIASVPPVITEGESTTVILSENGSPTAFAFTLHATDADGNTLTWSIASQASYGIASASGTGNSMDIGYSPDIDYTGSDSFVVQVNDGEGGTDTITVNVAIYSRDLLGGTTLLSTASDGALANSDSGLPSISADGRYVAFNSAATNLVSGDSGSLGDVYLRDRQTGETSLVSVASDGTIGNNDSYNPSISADGRYVAFVSWASNLVSGDKNKTLDIFVHDMQTGATSLVSANGSGVPASGLSEYPSISADGRYVAFASFASDLVTGDTNSQPDIFIRDLQTKKTSLVSLGYNGVQGNGASFYPSVSADGRYVAFASSADNLVTGDTNQAGDIFIRDLQTGTIKLVSVASNGTQGNAGSTVPSISADGSDVVFDSEASTLISGDTNAASDVFIHIMQTGATTRLSVASDGSQGNGDSINSKISDDGHYVAFQSAASNLVESDTNGTDDIFIHDMLTGETMCASLSTEDIPGNAGSADPWLSSTGGSLAFVSSASDLVAGDTNAAQDVFVRDFIGTHAANDHSALITEGASTSVTMSENNFPTPFALSLHASDQDYDTLEWSVIIPANHGTASVSGTGNLKAVDYSPDMNYTGLDSFVVRVDDGNGGIDSITVRIGIGQPAPKVRDDYDGDGKSDPVKFDPATGIVWWLKSSTGTWDGLWMGSDTFQYVSGSDFDGDGKTDPAKFYPNAGVVWWAKSTTGTLDGQWLGPDLFTYITGSDFDGDGKADPAKFYPETGTVWWVNSSTGILGGQWLGSDSFQYISGSDFDGDGNADPAKFYPATGTVWWVRSSDGKMDGMWLGPDAFTYVGASYFDGDGKTDPAKFYPATGTLWWVRSSDGVMDGAWLGPGTYTLIAGDDFNGDGKTDPAIYTSTTHTLSWLNTTTGIWTNVDMGVGNYNVVNGQ